MKNKLFSFILSLIVTIAVTAFSFHYLSYLKNKKGFHARNSFLQFIETVDLRFNDFKYKYMKQRSTKAPVVLIAVDEESLRQMGRWPWGRDVVAELTDKVLSFGAKSVGMDIIQAEPDLNHPEKDAKLGAVVEKNKEKIVLGTYSEDGLHLLPYQDYCVTEAFLQSGGKNIVKLNTKLAVDDLSDNFDDLRWSDIFASIFSAVQSATEDEYLQEIKKKSVSELTSFQKKYLESKKTRQLFDYCSKWLTADDSVYFQNMDVLQTEYKKLFDNKEPFKTLSADAQLARFKKEVLEFPTPQYGEWQGNISAIQDPAAYTASFVAYLDLDGYVRRYPLFYRSGSKLGTSFIPSLALQTYLTATGYRADVKVEVKDSEKAIGSFQIINPQTDPETVVYDLPTDHLGRLMVNYYGPAYTLPSVSAKDLYSDDPYITVMTQDGDVGNDQIKIKTEKFLKTEFFKDKMVVMGVTAVGLYDLRNTPVSANYPGPEIHLTMLANLFEGQFIKPLKNAEIVLPIALFAVGLIFSTLLAISGAFWTLLSFAMALVASYALDQYLFSQYHLTFSSFLIPFEIAGIHLTVFIYKYFSEERKRSELKKTFSKYVSPAVVDELLRSEENLKLGGRKQELSVFFSDVRGFTEFSEKMDPQELSQFLNEYLTPMTEVVFGNKGTLDKYMGDGLMAFFGAPVAFEDHAYCACKCALQSMEELKKLQIAFAKRGWPPLDIGIGINTGSMSVGNMGSQIVQSYTVIGDAVNLAARLEGTTKEYGAKILVSEFTYEKVKDRFTFREVDRVRVKGKKEPVRAYELLSEVAQQSTVVWLDRYREAYLVYHQKDFTKAYEMFCDLERSYPDDKLVKVYKERCENFLLTPPDPMWDGVYDRRTK